MHHKPHIFFANAMFDPREKEVREGMRAAEVWGDLAYQTQKEQHETAVKQSYPYQWRQQARVELDPEAYTDGRIFWHGHNKERIAWI